MKRGRGDDWMPLWIDKWLFGSTRLEMITGEKQTWTDYRGILLDLFALSKKDDGFIRANENTPYPLSQLAGTFHVPEEKLKECIKLCLKYRKLVETSPGIYYVQSTATYELSARHKRRFQEKGAEHEDTGDEGAIDRIDENGEDPGPEGGTKATRAEFRELWDAWPGEKGDRGEALEAYKDLRIVQPIVVIADGVNEYVIDLAKKRHPKKGEKPFEQEPMYLSTFLRKNRWKRFYDLSQRKEKEGKKTKS